MVTKIDLEKLDTYITDLQTLHSAWADKKYSREDVGDNAGYTVIAIERLSTSYERMQGSFVNLMDKTITYMKNRKASFEAQDNTATDTIETKAPIVKQGVNSNNNSGVMGKTPLTK